MSVICSKCGGQTAHRRLAAGEVRRCDLCFALLATSDESIGVRRGPAWKFLLVWGLLCAGAATVDLQRRATHLNGAIQRSSSTREVSESQRAASKEKLRLSHLDRLRALELSHRSKMQDPALLSGDSAEKARAEEWAARLRRDRAFAKTALELNLLAMELVARDDTLTVAQSLFQVASLASPPRSRIEIVPEVKRFKIRIAFDMGAVSWEEAGGNTKHSSTDALRVEAEQMTVRVIRDVLAACGSGDIERLSVSCNRPLQPTEQAIEAVPADPARASKPRPSRMTLIFRAGIDQASAAGVADWRSASMAQVGRGMVVEYDRTRRLRLSYVLEEPQIATEPEGELEF